MREVVDFNNVRFRFDLDNPDKYDTYAIEKNILKYEEFKKNIPMKRFDFVFKYPLFIFKLNDGSTPTEVFKVYEMLQTNDEFLPKLTRSQFKKQMLFKGYISDGKTFVKVEDNVKIEKEMM